MVDVVELCRRLSRSWVAARTHDSLVAFALEQRELSRLVALLIHFGFAFINTLELFANGVEFETGFVALGHQALGLVSGGRRILFGGIQSALELSHGLFGVACPNLQRGSQCLRLVSFLLESVLPRATARGGRNHRFLFPKSIRE